MNSLVVIEDNRGKVHRMSKEAIVGAQKLGGDVFALVIGENASSLSSDLSQGDEAMSYAWRHSALGCRGLNLFRVAGGHALC